MDKPNGPADASDSKSFAPTQGADPESLGPMSELPRDSQMWKDTESTTSGTPRPPASDSTSETPSPFRSRRKTPERRAANSQRSEPDRRRRPDEPPEEPPPDVRRSLKELAWWVLLPALFGWFIDSDGTVGMIFFGLAGLAIFVAVR